MRSYPLARSSIDDPLKGAFTQATLKSSVVRRASRQTVRNSIAGKRSVGRKDGNADHDFLR